MFLCAFVFLVSKQCPGRFIGIISHDPRVSKSNRLHFVNFCLLSEWEVYSIDSSVMVGKFPEVLNFNWLYLKLNWFIRKLAVGYPCSLLHKDFTVPLLRACIAFKFRDVVH